MNTHAITYDFSHMYRVGLSILLRLLLVFVVFFCDQLAAGSSTSRVSLLSQPLNLPERVKVAPVEKKVTVASSSRVKSAPSAKSAQKTKSTQKTKTAPKVKSQTKLAKTVAPVRRTSAAANPKKNKSLTLQDLPRHYESWQLIISQGKPFPACELRSNWVDSHDGLSDIKLSFRIDSRRLIVATQSSVDPFARDVGLRKANGDLIKFDYVYQDTDAVFEFLFDDVKTEITSQDQVEFLLAYWPLNTDSTIVSSVLDTSELSLAMLELNRCNSLLSQST